MPASTRRVLNQNQRADYDRFRQIQNQGGTLGTNQQARFNQLEGMRTAAGKTAFAPKVQPTISGTAGSGPITQAPLQSTAPTSQLQDLDTFNSSIKKAESYLKLDPQTRPTTFDQYQAQDQNPPLSGMPIRNLPLQTKSNLDIAGQAQSQYQPLHEQLGGTGGGPIMEQKVPQYGSLGQVQGPSYSDMVSAFQRGGLKPSGRLTKRAPVKNLPLMRRGQPF